MNEVIAFGGLQLRFLQSGDKTGGSLDLFEMLVQPKAGMPVPHYHDSWDETVYGLSGVSTWRVDGRDVALAAGETVFIRRGVVHGFGNVTDSPATCLCLLTPGVLGPQYFRDMRALVTGPSPEPAALKATMLRYGLVPEPSG